VLQPFTAVVVAAVHVYLAAGHLWPLFGGDVQWTHIWKGFGALGGAYVFAALASRAFSRKRGLGDAMPNLRDLAHVVPVLDRDKAGRPSVRL